MLKILKIHSLGYSLTQLFTELPVLTVSQYQSVDIKVQYQGLTSDLV